MRTFPALLYPGVALSLALQVAPLGAQKVGPPEEARLATATAGTGTPVVIVTGMLGSAYGFRKVIPGLVAAGFRVTVVDPLGFGASPRPSGADYSAAAQAGRVAHAIELLREGPVILTCHALAGPICLRLAYRRPDLVRGIVSINGGASEAAGTAEMRFALKFARIVLFFAGRDFALHKVKDGLIESSGDPAWVTDSLVARYVAPFGPDVREVVKTMQQIVNAHEPEPLGSNLARVRAPVLLLYGPVTQNPRKPALPAADRATLRANVPRFEEEDVPGAGQFIQEEQPGRVVAAIEKMRALTAAGPASP